MQYNTTTAINIYICFNICLLFFKFFCFNILDVSINVLPIAYAFMLERTRHIEQVITHVYILSQYQNYIVICTQNFACKVVSIFCIQTAFDAMFCNQIIQTVCMQTTNIILNANICRYVCVQPGYWFTISSWI